jgi:hypothetical protein
MFDQTVGIMSLLDKNEEALIYHKILGITLMDRIKHKKQEGKLFMEQYLLLTLFNLLMLNL